MEGQHLILPVCGVGVFATWNVSLKHSTTTEFSAMCWHFLCLIRKVGEHCSKYPPRNDSRLLRVS